jgi:hypothetical protein
MYLKFDPAEVGFVYYETKEAFLTRYPKHIFGHYMPQPRFDPDRFPVWVYDDGTVIDNPNGPDKHALFYLYGDQVIEVADPIDIEAVLHQQTIHIS